MLAGKHVDVHADAVLNATNEAHEAAAVNASFIEQCTHMDDDLSRMHGIREKVVLINKLIDDLEQAVDRLFPPAASRVLEKQL